MSKNNIPQFSIRQLIEAGVHFGHKTMRRNPKMSKYIYTNRNGISIIDLNKTAEILYSSLNTVKEIAKNNGRILFVATKKQAIEPIAEAAKRCGQYYVNSRWLGGMLTNWKTVSQSIKTLKKIEEKLADTEIGFNKKEKLMLEREKSKLEQNLGGIKDMGGYPDLVFIIDTNKEALAIAEAKKLNIPIMAIVDTNCNPDSVNYVIPGNDDSAKSIKLYCRLISDAIIVGVKENMIASGVEINKLENKNSKNSEEKKSEKIVTKESEEKEESLQEDSQASKKDKKTNIKKSEKSEVKVVTKRNNNKKVATKK